MHVVIKQIISSLQAKLILPLEESSVNLDIAVVNSIIVVDVCLLSNFDSGKTGNDIYYS